MNLTSLGAQILENMNPFHDFTGSLAPNTVAKYNKSTNDGVDAYRVGLNTFNHDIPSNDHFNLSEDSVHPTHSREARSLMYSASKKLIRKEENNEAIEQNLQVLQEAVMYKSKTWAAQAEKEEEEYDSDKKCEEDEDEHISNSWAVQIGEEEGNEVDSADSYGAIVKKMQLLPTHKRSLHQVQKHQEGRRRNCSRCNMTNQ
ncbi:hypothetical protein A4A49_36967 [Nicotiana attenuata]|uniref:Uncharacterized protein n=1 Tax=Nicotiana attenuata TaxID=49451 RepID=A0A1J6K072_NICAT|nr:hypothetical protein A4A49_36967 [Nicotiana attenuata]